MLLSSLTGWTKTEVLDMPAWEFNGWLDEVGYVQAYRLSDAITAATVSNMEEEPRRELFRDLRKRLDSRSKDERIAESWKKLPEALGA